MSKTSINNATSDSPLPHTSAPLNIVMGGLTSTTATANDDDVDGDYFYIVLFSALKQTHCTHKWVYTSD